MYRTRAPELLTQVSALRSRLRRLAQVTDQRRPQVDQDPPSSVNGLAPGNRTNGLAASGRWVDWLSWWLQVPDLVIGWLPWGLAATLDAVNRYRGRALYSSAPHWTAHLIGLLSKRMTGLPWVADFRDPWRANPFRKIPYSSIDDFDKFLEGQVVRHANRVICNSEFVRDNFVGRFPELSDRFVTVPNGFDPEDFADLESRRPIGQGHLVLTHAGFFYGPRRPHPILQALRVLRDRNPLDRIPCLQLVGPPTYEGRCLRSIASDYGVEDLVHVPGELAHRQVLELMRGSDIQVLVGFSGKGSEFQVPAKLFDYLGVGRPVLALAPERGAIGEVMRQSGVIGALCSPDDPEEIAAGISRLAARQAGPPDVSSAGADVGPSITRFHRYEQVGRIAKTLDTLSSRR